MSTKLLLEKFKSITTLEDLDQFEAQYGAQASKTLKDKMTSKRRQIQKVVEKYTQMSVFESQFFREGLAPIAGIDEAGRGPLAGPVVAAAVVLDPNRPIYGLDDSKKLSEKMREYLYQEIQTSALAVGIGFATSTEIDALNILQATRLAAKRAYDQLELFPMALLLDALELEDCQVSQLSLIKGDQRSVSIAAASILAKVTRDHYMKRLAQAYPEYGFESHKGYGTERHYEALKRYGRTPEHRASFLKNFEEGRE